MRDSQKDTAKDKGAWTDITSFSAGMYCAFDRLARWIIRKEKATFLDSMEFLMQTQQVILIQYLYKYFDEIV